MKKNDFDITEARAVLDWAKENLSKKRCSKCGQVKEVCNVKPKYNSDTWTGDLENWYYACEPCARKFGQIDD